MVDLLDRKEYVRAIDRLLREFPVVALPGARQAGKTTLARMFCRALGDRQRIHFFDLESPADLARLSNPEMALGGLSGLVVLDEIQRLPEMYPVLRVLVDRQDSPTRFLILGSASPALIKGASESLAGRIAFVDVSGFSLGEVGTERADSLWWRGGFPRAYLATSDDAARRWHESFIRTFLERDVPQLGISIPATTLRRFWIMVAHYHGQILKVSELARSLGSSEPTARRYLDILCGTYMVRQLPPWFENLKKRQVKAPKVYIRDSGVCHALLGIQEPEGLQAHPKLGASFEGFCLEQMISVAGERQAYYWATHGGAELDLLLFHRGRRLGFEFKYSERPEITKSMRIALDDLGLDQIYLVYPGRHIFPLDPKITATSLPGALKALGSTKIGL